jgi:hypothetical protein
MCWEELASMGRVLVSSLCDIGRPLSRQGKEHGAERLNESRKQVKS